MEKPELASALTRAAKLSGSFKLRSGQISDTYFDKYQFESDPKLLKAIALEMAKLVPTNTDVLAGLELGGVPLATAISLESNLPAAYVRKERKTYGTLKIAEGAEVNAKRVTIIEDIITTGGAVIDAVHHLREDGARIETVVCVILRAEEPPQGLLDLGLTIQPVFRQNDLG